MRLFRKRATAQNAADARKVAAWIAEILNPYRAVVEIPDAFQDGIMRGGEPR